MHGTFEEDPTGLIPWFSKLREILTLHFAASPSPLRGKPTLAQDVGPVLLDQEGEDIIELCAEREGPVHSVLDRGAS